MDQLLTATAGGGTLRAVILTATATVEEARRRHGTSALATAALGRTLMAAALMAAGLKEEGSITLRILGDGPLGAIVTTANAAGEIRGYLQNPDVELPLNPRGKLNVGAGVGAGTLHVARDIGLGAPYIGSVALDSGEIGEDLARYLLVSEQIPSAVSMGVRIDPDGSVAGAGALLLQVLPGAPADAPRLLEERLLALGAVSSAVAEGKGPSALAETVLRGLDPRLALPQPLRFQCSCSRSRSAALLQALGPEELRSLLEEGEARLTCHFCREEYVFGQSELGSLLAEAEGIHSRSQEENLAQQVEPEQQNENQTEGAVPGQVNEPQVDTEEDR